MKLTLLTLVLITAACGGKEPAPAKPEPAPVAEPEPAPPPAPEEPPAPDPEAIKAGLMTNEVAAFDKAKPVFDKFCTACHVKGQKNASAKKLKEFDMTAYPFAGEHNKAADIREVLGTTGKKATMPKGKPGSVKGDDLAAIVAWADAWDAAEAGGAHEGAPPAAE